MKKLNPFLKSVDKEQIAIILEEIFKEICDIPSYKCRAIWEMYVKEI